MLAHSDLFLPFAFSVSGLMIVAALVLLRVGARQSKRSARVGTDGQARPKRSETLQLFSGATMVALEQVTRLNPGGRVRALGEPRAITNPARKRQRMYCRQMTLGS